MLQPAPTKSKKLCCASTGKRTDFFAAKIMISLVLTLFSGCKTKDYVEGRWVETSLFESPLLNSPKMSHDTKK